MPKTRTPALADYRIFFTSSFGGTGSVDIRAAHIRISAGWLYLEDGGASPLFAAPAQHVAFVKLLTDEDRKAAAAPDPASPAAEIVTPPSARSKRGGAHA